MQGLNDKQLRDIVFASPSFALGCVEYYLNLGVYAQYFPVLGLAEGILCLSVC